MGSETAPRPLAAAEAGKLADFASAAAAVQSADTPDLRELQSAAERLATEARAEAGAASAAPGAGAAGWRGEAPQKSVRTGVWSKSHIAATWIAAAAARRIIHAYAKGGWSKYQKRTTS